MSAAEIGDYFDWACSRPGVILDESQDHRPAFHASSGLMSDVSSFLLEYLALDRPILYLEVEDGPGLNDDGEVRRAFEIARDEAAIRAFIEEVVRGRDLRAEVRRATTPEFLFGLDGQAGHRVMAHVVEAVLQEGARRPGGRPPKSEARVQEQAAAAAFWRDCADSRLAPPDYYDRQESVLRERILPRLPEGAEVLDLGCGDGRFTMVLAERAAGVQGVDLSPILIQAARARAGDAADRVRFEEGDIRTFRPQRPFGVVACMGVFSAMITESSFEQLVNVLDRSLAPDGRLILKDTLSTRDEAELIDTVEYTALYRPRRRYEAALEKRGLVQEVAIQLGESEGRVNILSLWRRRSTAGLSAQAA